MNVFLIGYRGTGKTTIAELLADRLQCNWADADPLIEARAGKSIRQIFLEQGEPAFRDAETAVVLELAARKGAVLALGGGAILRPENREAIRASGKVVWLKADPQTIFERVQADTLTPERRPNLTATGGLDEICQLLESRTPCYEQSADVAIETTGKAPEQIVHEILAWLARAELTE